MKFPSRGWMRMILLAIALAVVVSVRAYTQWSERVAEERHVLGLLLGDELVEAAAGAPRPGSDQLNLLSRLVAAEARGEPFAGQVAVAAVMLNRVSSPQFPNSLAGVILQPHAVEAVTNGLIWRRSPKASEIRAAQAALNGWDPTYGALYYWNPRKSTSRWILSRRITMRLGKHVFGS